jgi:hypothetical protein
VENGRFLEAEAKLLACALVEPRVKKLGEGNKKYTLPEVKEQTSPSSPPKLITAVPRLQKDVKALANIFNQEIPAQVLLWMAWVYTIVWLGGCIGVRFWHHHYAGRRNKYRIGTWDSDTEDGTSNYQEFENIVEAPREEADAGNLCNTLIFLCTDSSTVECTIVKGNSSSEKLYELALEVRTIEMRKGARVMVSHVMGERMKAQGMDGVLRGQLKERVSAGKSMLSFVPFHLSSIQRSLGSGPGWAKMQKCSHRKGRGKTQRPGFLETHNKDKNLHLGPTFCCHPSSY